MKKILFSVCLLATCCMLFFGCIKNRPYVTTDNPTMIADIGSFKFISSTVTPATIDTQRVDTSTTLVITGFSSDRANPYDKIVLAIANYKGVTGTFSIAQGAAHAYYDHSVYSGIALGGIVSVTEVTTTVISGYFSFNTDDGIAVTNGKFTVKKPY